MCCQVFDAVFIQCDQSIDLLVDVQVFNKPFSEEIIEVFQPEAQILNMLLCDFRPCLCCSFFFFDDDQWPYQPASIRCNVNSILLVIDVYRHKLLNPAPLSEKTEVFHELQWLSVNSNWLTIQVNDEVLFGVQLIASD